MIYFWSISGSLDTTLELLTLLCGLMCIMVFLAWHIGGVDEAGPFRRKCSILFAILLSASTLMPDKQTVALMVVAPAIINSEPIQKDLPEIYQMAKDALKQTLQPSK